MNSWKKIALAFLVLGNLFLCAANLIFFVVTLRVNLLDNAARVAFGETSTATSIPIPTVKPSILSPTPSVATLTPSTPLKTPTLPNSTSSGNMAALVQSLDLVVNDLVLDSARHVLYASVPGADGPEGNSVTSIDLSTWTRGTSIPVGSEPGELALSGDGQYLYVGLDGTGSVRRVNLKTQKAEIEFALGSDWCGPLVVGDMAVVPGNAAAVVISKGRQGCTPSFAGLTLYVDGVERSRSVSEHTGSTVLQFLSPTVLYGYDSHTTDYTLETLTVSAEGIVVTSSVKNLFSGGLRVRLQDGLLYSTNGQVIDPSKMKLVGTFAVGGYLFDPKSMSSRSTLPVGGWVVPDSTAGRVYFLTLPSYRGPFQIKVFDLRTFVLLDSIDLEEIAGIPFELIQTGSGQFAFQTTAGKLYLIRLVPAGMRTN